ncbi:MAG: hypothetical protein PHF14_03390, partial [Verrucomicrobiota bacterium]|nr:hypothetical protein [Verrucomicrobiota bacterium]
MRTNCGSRTTCPLDSDCDPDSDPDFDPDFDFDFDFDFEASLAPSVDPTSPGPSGPMTHTQFHALGQTRV